MHRQMSTVGINSRSLCIISAAQPVDTRPTTEPTDRSMSPSSTIMVMPMAMMPVSDTARSRFIRLVTLRKVLRPFLTQMILPIMKITTSAI